MSKEARPERSYSILGPDELEQFALPEADAQVWVDKEGNRTTKRIRVIDKSSAEAADLDGDGHLSDEEIRAFSEAEQDAGPGEHNVIFIRERVDTLAAPKPDLTSEQRRAHFLKDHPEADLNGDGVISPEEAEALAAKQGPKPGPGPHPKPKNQ